MSELFNNVRDITLLSLFLRLTLAVISGGAIGAERELKRRSAGFRTHILICLGAAVAAVTGQFLGVYMHYYTDMTRLGAQVIAGIGFIGAGAIISTPRKRVRGLTTSAGLWAAGIVGLCYGSGFFEGGIAATVMILVSEILLSKLEWLIGRQAPEVTMYVEYEDKTALNQIIHLLARHQIDIVSSEFSKTDDTDAVKGTRIAILQMQPVKGLSMPEVVDELKRLQGVTEVEIL